MHAYLCEDILARPDFGRDLQGLLRPAYSLDSVYGQAEAQTIILVAKSSGGDGKNIVVNV